MNRLLQQIESNTTTNFVLSPHSIHSVFSQLLQGSGGRTKDELESLLGVRASDSLVVQYRILGQGLAGEGFKQANLLAVANNFKPKKNAWPFVTPSLKARASGMRPLSRRTKRSWLTCGTRSLSWLILTRTMKSALKNLKRESRFLVKEKATQICQMLSDISLTLNSEPLTLTVTVPLALPNSELTA